MSNLTSSHLTSRVPLAYRQAHFDSVTFHRPISLLSVIPRYEDVSYEELYYNPSKRKMAVEQGLIGWGNGGMTWDDYFKGKWSLSEGGLVRPGMVFGLYFSDEKNRWLVGWHWPRFKVTATDWGMPIWEKASKFSIVTFPFAEVSVTKGMAGTAEEGEEDAVIYTLTSYCLGLVNEMSAFEEKENGSVESRGLQVYGIKRGKKGWYKLLELIGDFNDKKHSLLSHLHYDAAPVYDNNIKTSIIIKSNQTLQWRRKAFGMLYKSPYSDHDTTGESFSIRLAPVEYPLFYDNNGYVQLVGDVSSPGPHKMYGARVVTMFVESINNIATLRKFGWFSFGRR